MVEEGDDHPEEHLTHSEDDGGLHLKGIQPRDLVVTQDPDLGWWDGLLVGVLWRILIVGDFWVVLWWIDDKSWFGFVVGFVGGFVGGFVVALLVVLWWFCGGFVVVLWWFCGGFVGGFVVVLAGVYG